MSGPSYGPAPNAFARRGFLFPLVLGAALVAMAAAPAAVAGPPIVFGPTPPLFLYTPPLTDPDACICLPPYMLQDPNAVHLWWVKAVGGSNLTVTPIALSVNAAENSTLRFRLLGPSGFEVANATILNAGSPGTEIEGSAMTAPAPAAGDLYRIDVSLSSTPGLPVARHYRLRADGASVMGAPSPLAAQAEAENVRWGINVAPGEFPEVRVFGGPEAGATTATIQLLDPAGILRVVGPLNVGIFSGLSIPGMWTVAVRGADGHYMVEKIGGIDGGVYLHAFSWGYGSIDGAIFLGPSPNPTPMRVEIRDAATGALVRDLEGVTASFLAEKLPLGSYNVFLIPPPGTPAPPPQFVVLSCDEVARVEFRFVAAPPVADAGRPQDVPEGSLVMLDGTASFDPEGGPLSYSWTLLAFTGEPITLSDLTAATPMFFGGDDGAYLFELTVRDISGLWATDLVDVRVHNVAPTADAGGPYSSPWGLPIAFDGTATDAGPLDVPDLSATWSFGDGATSTGPLDVAHAYATAGSYAVALNVSDDDGGLGSDGTFATISLRPTSTTYLGATSAVAGNPILIAATLADLVRTADQRLAGLLIDLTVGGTTYALTIDASGYGATTVTLPAGTYAVTASFAGNADYLPSSTPATLVVTPPGNPFGHVTGGSMRFASEGRGGFNVRSDGSGVIGELQFQNGATNFHARTITALLVSFDCRTATFAGVGVDGRPFEAYMEDNGEPGRADVFRLTIAGTPANGDGTMLRGNLQIHC